jgi:NAD(P)-dependent dehydrogenase (short-subunit alcohol dehydrogenase family)
MAQDWRNKRGRVPGEGHCPVRGWTAGRLRRLLSKLSRRGFNGKSVIITGATSGIGRAAAAAFAAERSHLVLVGRDQGALHAAVAEVESAGGRGVACAADVTADDAPERIVRSALDAYGGIDVLVNAAGVIATGTLETTTDEAWDAMMALNLRAPFRLMREALPHLRSRRGAVVNVSSVNGLRSFAGVLAYCVSKAGVDHLTRCAALELAPLGVRVNAVNPGVTVTNLHRRSGMADAQYAAFLERSKETHPLGRPGQPDEVAALILFLASERAAWMTGETIPIDGGRHLTCLR